MVLGSQDLPSVQLSLEVLNFPREGRRWNILSPCRWKGGRRNPFQSSPMRSLSLQQGSIVSKLQGQRTNDPKELFLSLHNLHSSRLG